MTSIGTSQTLAFVKEFITGPDSNILEVGSKDSGLTEELGNAGYQVTAIENILEFQSEEGFDGVLFTRSFHNLQSLETVLNQTKKLLNEKGRILIEDFANEQMDVKTAAWFYDLGDVMTAVVGGSIEEGTDGPLERWKKEHDSAPSVHTRKEIIKVMEKNFGNIHSLTIPYLYRYFEEKLSASENSSQAIQKIYDWEIKSIAKGLLEPIGMRIVAKKYFSYLK